MSAGKMKQNTTRMETKKIFAAFGTRHSSCSEYAGQGPQYCEQGAHMQNQKTAPGYFPAYVNLGMNYKRHTHPSLCALHCCPELPRRPPWEKNRETPPNTHCERKVPAAEQTMSATPPAPACSPCRTALTGVCAWRCEALTGSECTHASHQIPWQPRPCGLGLTPTNTECTSPAQPAPTATRSPPRLDAMTVVSCMKPPANEGDICAHQPVQSW
jgi:hypothetical protein